VLGEDREKKGKEEDPTFISSPSSSSFTFLYVNEMEEVEEEMKVKDGERSDERRWKNTTLRFDLRVLPLVFFPSLA